MWILPNVQLEVAESYSLFRPKGETAMVLGIPEQGAVEGYTINQRVPQSEWLGLLRAWKWSEVEVFEVVLPFETSPTADLRNALELVGRAGELFRSGHYAETFTACRSALDRFAKDLGGSDDPRAGAQVLADHIGGKKGETVGELLRSLKKFTNVGSHETHPREPVEQADALLVLRSTMAALSYIAALPVRNARPV